MPYFGDYFGLTPAAPSGITVQDILDGMNAAPPAVNVTLWNDAAVAGAPALESTAQAILLDTGTTLPGLIGGEVIEGTYTRDDVLRIVAAALAGVTSGSGTASPTFTGLDGVTTRIAATVSEAGNRTAVVLDGAA